MYATVASAHVEMKENCIRCHMDGRIFGSILTLYENRSWTTQVITASLPTGMVIFVIGELKFGSAAVDGLDCCPLCAGARIHQMPGIDSRGGRTHKKVASVSERERETQRKKTISNNYYYLCWFEERMRRVCISILSALGY